jgi:hypothetical protein
MENLPFLNLVSDAIQPKPGQPLSLLKAHGLPFSATYSAAMPMRSAM